MAEDRRQEVGGRDGWRQMIRYILKRILQMVLTVFGVILITFALFNIAGGDTAMLKLGKQARARTLEEYDVQRGYDKPLFFGLWGKTRAYRTDLSINAGPWSTVDGVAYTNRPRRLLMPGARSYGIPTAFTLQTNQVFRWTIHYRLDGAAEFQFAEGSNTVQTCPLNAAPGWMTAHIDVPAEKAASKFAFAVGEGSVLEVRNLRLERRTEGFFDSQFAMFVRQISKFDFGRSAETNQEVSRMILDGILPSLSLTFPIFVFAMVLEIMLALVCAFYRNTFIDRFFVVISVALMSINFLVWIIGGQYVLAFRLGWFPIWGYESARYLILPWIIGVVSGLGGGVRFYRTIMLDEMYRDYVRTAFAKGVSKAGVLFKHVLKNAMIPILTSSVMALAHLYNGSLLLETFFGIPGLGNLSITALNNADFDVLRVVVLIGGVIYVVANLVTDICYTLVDPRVRLK